MFQVGDRVRCVKKYVDSYKVLGLFGTVRVLMNGSIGVEWDDFSNGHGLDGSIENRKSGWWVDPRCVELIEDEFDDDNPVDEDALIKLISAT